MKPEVDQPAWTPAVMLESLEMMGSINRTRLNEIHEWRELRNKVVHDVATPSIQDAKRIIDLGVGLYRDQASRS